MTLFEQAQIVGSFLGFSEGGLEFHADLILPYRNYFQSSPMHGQFVLVALENDAEAIVGRITAISAQGRLVSPAGEDYALRQQREDRPVPEDLRDQFLKYRVNIRILGVLRSRGGDKPPLFVPFAPAASACRSEGCFPVRRIAPARRGRHGHWPARCGTRIPRPRRIRLRGPGRPRR